MSDNDIPFEIQSEIIKHLPVKSLLQFRSVCKSWKSLIDSSEFVKHYTTRHQHPLLSVCDFDQGHIWTIDDDDHHHTFPNHRVSIALPELVKELQYPYIIGSSHGLLCFADIEAVNIALLWNPSIRKAVSVFVPDVTDDYDDDDDTVLGFGVCRETTDPKIVKITTDLVGVKPWEVEVFSLSTGAWRSPYSSIFPRTTIFLHLGQVVNGFLYWLASDKIFLDDGTFRLFHLIVSFDLTTEEFGEVSLPDSLVQSHVGLSIHKLRESVVVIESREEDYNRLHHLWMMEDGVPKSFEKLFTINSPSPDLSIACVRGFRKTGEPLIELQAHRGTTSILATYEPNSKSITNVGIDGRHSSYYVDSYMETLLLL